MTTELEALREAREQYAAFARGVELDLARERERRLSTERLRIRQLIVQAAAAGETTAAIKRAYGTSDHRTIKDVIDSAQAEIAALREAKARVITDDGTNVEGYEVTFYDPSDPTTISEEVDGWVVAPTGKKYGWFVSDDDAGELGLDTGDFESDGDEQLRPLFAAIRNAMGG